jgi:hypothetical protein
MGLDAVLPGTQSGKTATARAYCEGRQASANGALETTNPFPDTKGEYFVAWDQGWVDHDGSLLTAREVGCSV